MSLTSLVRDLDRMDEDFTIYARQPWGPDSDAIAAAEPANGGLPAEARERGLSYFLEVSVAKEFLEGWLQNSGQQPMLAQVERLIHYAIHDA